MTSPDSSQPLLLQQTSGLKVHEIGWPNACLAQKKELALICDKVNIPAPPFWWFCLPVTVSGTGYLRPLT